MGVEFSKEQEIMPIEYHFNGHLRWSLFWENPNYTAAFLACLLGWLWCAQHSLSLEFKFKRLTLGVLLTVYALELGVWFLLAKTYSRGGLVAATAGMLFFFVLHGLRGRGKVAQTFLSVPSVKFVKIGTGRSVCATFTGWKPVLRGIITRVAVVAVICIAVGFAPRLSPAYAMQDNSVLNRFEMWKGAMTMMHDSPLHGWGRGLGGVAYVDWYQPLEALQRPIGFVNSYLEIAVEYGTHVLFVALACALAFVLMAVKLRKRHVWALGAGSVFITWLIANLLTSLWAEPTLWILPGVAMVCLIVGALLATPLFSSIRRKSGVASNVPTWEQDAPATLKILAISSAASLIICGLLVLAGGAMSKDRKYRARPLRQSDAVLVAKRGNDRDEQPIFEIWVDGAVFGNFWGKTLRAMLDGTRGIKLLVYAPWAHGNVHLDKNPQASIYSGFQVEAINANRNPAGKIIILHPNGLPPVGETILNTEKVVCLPAVDASSFSMPWKIWAAKHAERSLYSPQGGMRIMPSTNLPFWRTLLFND